MAARLRPRLVIDASVAAKWLVRESGSEAAEQFLFRYQAGQLEAIAPSILIAEAGSALVKYVRSRALSAADARYAMDFLLSNSPVLIDPRDIAESALELAIAHGSTFYDCLYLALALREDCELVTADERFVRGLGMAFPRVRSLGSWIQ